MGSHPLFTTMTRLSVELKNKVLQVHEISKHGMSAFIQSISRKQLDESQPFYILDLGSVERLMEKWKKLLPSIKPFYAVKCNNEPSLLAALASLGANFDCASRAEIESVLALGVSPNRIIYANTCKSVSELKFAAKVGVNLTTFDSMFELDKIKKWHPKCDLLLRIRILNDGSSSVYPLGSKFGALPDEIAPLLQEAHGTGLNVVGVTFHVGSIATDPSIYKDAVYAVKKTFDMAVAELHMPPMRVIDIGGGFRDSPLFNEVANIIKNAIKDCFQDENVAIMAEPGRFFCETAFTLVTNVIGKRIRGLKREYWIDEGIYRSFRSALDEGSLVSLEPLRLDPMEEESQYWLFPSTVFGHTCDSGDVVVSETMLPEIQMEDLLVFCNMGAYTLSTGTSFNGFSTSSIPIHLAYSSN